MNYRESIDYLNSLDLEVLVTVVDQAKELEAKIQAYADEAH